MSKGREHFIVPLYGNGSNLSYDRSDIWVYEEDEQVARGIVEWNIFEYGTEGFLFNWFDSLLI